MTTPTKNKEAEAAISTSTSVVANNASKKLSTTSISSKPTSTKKQQQQQQHVEWNPDSATPTRTKPISTGAPPLPPAEPLPLRLDFIGPSQAVKDLFALPYATEREVSVALHNMDGTLLIDAVPRISLAAAAGTETTATAPQLWQRQRRRRLRPTQSDDYQSGSASARSSSTADAARPPLLPPPSSFMLLPHDELGQGINREDDTEHSEALALVASAIQQKNLRSPYYLASSSDNQDTTATTTTTSGNNALSLPRPEEYTQDVLPTPPEPREFLSWKFREYNLLVGTDALIYRDSTNPSGSTNNNNNSNNNLPCNQSDEDATTTAPSSKSLPSTTPTAKTTSSSSQSLAVRIEEVSTIQSLLAKHQDMVRKGEFVADYHLPLWQQRGKPSYAQAVAAAAAAEAANSSNKSTMMNKNNHPNTSPSAASRSAALSVSAGSFAVPNLDQERLQTCIVPSYRSPLGGLLSPATGRHSQENDISSSSLPTTSTASPSASPVCTVLDAYLDNIMANVPQLALCLRERGFIQSIKLLQTDDIPSALLHPSTMDLSRPFANVVVPKVKGKNSEDDGALFSPHIMEMNAATLLRFLKANCTRDNVTYLLRRPVNQTNIELYDISSISTQRQRQWNWWLATMSYRFALRLGHLTSETGSTTLNSSSWQARQSQLRSFRVRQRSLFQNALDLLEELRDMDGGSHETLVAAICEHLADSYLTSSSSGSKYPPSEVSSPPTTTPHSNSGPTTPTTTSTESKVESPMQSRATVPTCTEREQPYATVTVDALNKAQDYLLRAIQMLRPLLETMSSNRLSPSNEDEKRQRRRSSEKASSGRHQQQQQRLVVSVRRDDDDDDDDNDSTDEDEGKDAAADDDDEDDSKDSDHEADATFPADTITLQLFGLHHKLINVALRLAEHHLHNYWSSSAMQSLRTSARRLADAVTLLRQLDDVHPYNESEIPLPQQSEQQLIGQYQRSLQVQYTWLLEHCGHFARSFASDENWRERGHASGDDVVSLLHDVEAAFSGQREKTNAWYNFITQPDSILTKTDGMVSLQSLSALIDPHVIKSGVPVKASATTKQSTDGLLMATKLFLELGQIARDKRRVLVAACVCYSRAIAAYQDLVMSAKSEQSIHSHCKMPATGEAFLALLQQRLGDTCNETGKALLTHLRQLLTSGCQDSAGNFAADVLLSSAEFWFLEGLAVFNDCHDLRNVALLRCNLCQCYKLRANSIFATITSLPISEPGSHAELCLEQAIHHLEAAHEALGVRDVDTRTWDMVSEELASTFLVLGVRRRQSLLGGGTTPILLQAFRLTPGKERSIVHPMERSLSIYEQLGNSHQAAAAHYQLALFYSKVWTCQRDEAKTREKLGAAFKHFSCAHSYFYNAPAGSEATFVLLCLDLSGLYAAVSGKECLDKALSSCLDTCAAFAQETIYSAVATGAVEWLQKMETLASSVEDRVFKLLKELVKLERETIHGSTKYKELYRTALTQKATSTPADGALQGKRLLDMHRLLSAVKAQHNEGAGM